MENKPINSEAFGYVRLHIPEKVNLDDFIIIEKYVAEMHNSFYRNDIYGDADLRRFVYQRLTEGNIFIEQSKVNAIVNALYDYMFEKGNLLSIDWIGKFDKWGDWEQTLSDSISEFILFYLCVPNVIIMSEYTKSQIELVSGTMHFSPLHTLQIDNSLPDKRFILLYSLDDDNDDISDIKDPTPILYADSLR